jgi:hypothetical protein
MAAPEAAQVWSACLDVHRRVRPAGLAAAGFMARRHSPSVAGATPPAPRALWTVSGAARVARQPEGDRAAARRGGRAPAPARAPSEAAQVARRSEGDRVALRRGGLVLAPELDSLVALRGQQPRAGRVERGAADVGLALQRPRLQRGLRLLEAVAAGPVPEPAAARAGVGSGSG